MIQRFLNDPAGAALECALNGYALRQRITANNIANAETPGFVRSAVSFESQLKAALEGKDSDDVIGEVRRVNPTADLDDSSPLRPDGNNVNMEQEIGDLNKTGLSYRAATVLLGLKQAMLKTAINGR